jgi:rhodanese-related sulfurtransferase
VSAKPGVPLSEYVSDVAEIGRLVGANKSTPMVLYGNGPFCGKSKRLSTELVEAGYTHVRRYRLKFAAQSLSGAQHLPRSAVMKDVGEVKAAKDDGRLPMEDPNTRIVVLGQDGAQAKAVAEAIAQESFHNVAYFGGTFETLIQQVAGKWGNASRPSAIPYILGLRSMGIQALRRGRIDVCCSVATGCPNVAIGQGTITQLLRPLVEPPSQDKVIVQQHDNGTLGARML